MMVSARAQITDVVEPARLVKHVTTGLPRHRKVPWLLAAHILVYLHMLFATPNVFIKGIIINAVKHFFMNERVAIGVFHVGACHPAHRRASPLQPYDVFRPAPWRRVYSH